MKKIISALALAADLAFGVMLVVIGTGVIVGFSTGALWY
jgi:hypothetical protein